MSGIAIHEHFINPSFNNALTHDYECVALLDNSDAAFLIKQNDDILALYTATYGEHTVNDLSVEDLKILPAFSHSFKKNTILLVPEADTLIPSAEFDSNLASKYLEFTSPTSGSEFVRHENTSDDIAFVYAISRALETKLLSLSPEMNSKSNKTVLHELFQNQSTKGKKLCVNVRSKAFDVFAYNDNALIFFNTFSFSTAQDFIFYLMSVVTQLQLDPAEIKLILSGFIDTNGSVYGMIYKYIKHIEFAKPQLINFPEISDRPIHYFYNILF